MQRNQITYHLWTRCRDVAVALLAACWPGRDFAEVSQWLEQCSPSVRKQVVFGVLAALFCLSLLAAQFGLIGLCVFWLAVIWVIR